jgi:hypothetical protein
VEARAPAAHPSKNIVGHAQPWRQGMGSCNKPQPSGFALDDHHPTGKNACHYLKSQTVTGTNELLCLMASKQGPRTRRNGWSGFSPTGFDPLRLDNSDVAVDREFGKALHSAHPAEAT